MPAWDPTVQQFAEADTTYLFSPAVEATLVPGVSGLIAGNASGGDVTPWEAGTPKVDVVTGKFLQGIKPNTASNGFLWMPCIGLVGAAEFTVEMWLKCDNAWASAGTSQTPFGVRMASDEFITVNIGTTGTLTLRYAHQHDAAAQVNKSITYANVGAHAAGEWVSVAFTLKNGTLTLYINGVSRGTATGCTSPGVWSDPARSTGLSLGGVGGAGATLWTLSDLRISRVARTPGQSPTLPSGSTITVDPATTTGRTINKKLLGVLHTLTLGAGSATPNATVLSKVQAAGVPVIRTDKALSSTPMKAGAPDGTRPTAGQSGLYSYDWRVVDRSLAYIIDTLGLDCYMSIDSVPQLLGGSVAPLSGTNLTNTDLRIGETGYAKGPISDLTAWGNIVRDFVYHCCVELGYRSRMPYWSAWNEPDGPSFWTQGGTRDAEVYAMYAATAAAVKAIDSTLKVGGVEASSVVNAPTLSAGLLAYCATNSVPLDFVVAHFYNGDHGEFRKYKAAIERQATASGVAAPELLNGEWNAWQTANFYAAGGGTAPFDDYDYQKNDFAAASMAASLIEMHRAGFKLGIYSGRTGSGVVGDSNLTGWDTPSLLDSSYRSWATRNAMELFQRLQTTEITTTEATTNDPGVFSVGSKDPATGKVSVLVANLHYRDDRTENVTVTGLPTGSVTCRMIDDTRSNMLDAGTSHAELETIPATLGSGAVTVAMKGRSALLLEVDPAGAADATVGRLVKVGSTPALLA